MNPKEIKEKLYRFPTKHKEGFTREELEQFCKSINLDVNKVRRNIGIVTSLLRDEEIITYHSDIEYGIMKTIKPNKSHIHIWD